MERAAYIIAHVKVTDDAWSPEYAARVHEIAGKHGGKYLSRSASITTLEGDAPDVTVIALIEFPSTEAAMAMVRDPEHEPFGKARQAGPDSVLVVIDDGDATGGISYLPSGAG